jgi:uncharacterized protein (TIGR03435 family)
MTVAAGGVKLQPPQPGKCRIIDPNIHIPPPPPPPRLPGQPWITLNPACGHFILNVNSTSEARLQAGYVTTSDFAKYLSTLLDTPIVDNTGYSGSFDLFLSFIPNRTMQDLRASILVAIREELGLLIQPAKSPVDILVIDHVEKPLLN